MPAGWSWKGGNGRGGYSVRAGTTDGTASARTHSACRRSANQFVEGLGD